MLLKARCCLTELQPALRLISVYQAALPEQAPQTSASAALLTSMTLLWRAMHIARAI